VFDIAEFDIADPEALFDMAEPLPAPPALLLPPLSAELAAVPLGADAVLLSFELVALESAVLLLQPTTAKHR
jgi:hypothetical protein